MRKLPSPYKLSDNALDVLCRRVAVRFMRIKDSFRKLGFDELTVYSGVNSLYSLLSEDCIEVFSQLARERYIEVYFSLTGERPDKKDVDFLVDMYLSGLLKTPCEVTKYAWEAECFRKRDRAIEAINSSKTHYEKNFELKRALRNWNKQSGLYVDIVSDGVALQAFKDCGISRVRWNAESDSRVCSECCERDGKTYRIGNIPAKHPNCRCWFSPVER